MAPSTLRRAPLTIALVMGALLACSGKDGETIDDEQMRDDVFECEDAVARLEDCCPGFVAQKLGCVHYQKEVVPTGCDAYGTSSTDKEDPSLDLGESRCIQAMSCDVMRKTGVCTRAQAARPRRSGKSSYEDERGHSSSGTSYDTPHTQVCP